MKHCIKILSLSFILLFILSCGNNNDPIENLKETARYEGALDTKQNTKQIIPNKGILIVREDSSIYLEIQGDNIYDDIVTISKEELTKVDEASYTAEKGGKKYSFSFYDTYMNLTINNTDNTTTEGKLSKIS